jgi:hypothetical protein
MTMTETSVPFDSAPAAPSPETGPEPTPSSNRSRLVLLGGVAGVVLVGILGYFLFFTGGDADPATDSQATPVVPTQSSAAETPAAVPQQKLNARSFGRDPFKALIVAAPAVVVAPGGAPAVGTSPSTTGDTSTGSTGSGGTSSGSTGTSAPSTTSSHSFRVVSVAPDNSTITVNVDGKKYSNLRAGEVFATYFKVRLISGPTNSFQYGEELFNVSGTQKLTIA